MSGSQPHSRSRPISGVGGSTGTGWAGTETGTTTGRTGGTESGSEGGGMMNRAMDTASDVAGRARDAVAGAAGTAGDLAGRAGGAVRKVPTAALVVGGLAAAVGGWWLMRSKRGDVELPEEHDDRYRSHFDSHPARGSGMSYDDARTGYAVGHVASENPDYAGRPYDEVETELRTGFSGESTGSYDNLRDFTRYGYEQGGTGGTGGTTGGMGGSGGPGGTGGTGGL